jgi:hypothetical protein
MSEKNLEELKLRVKVAELCGFKDLVWFSGELHHGPHGLNAAVVPDYPNDLNACHEFEEGLADCDKNFYVIHLSKEIGLAGRIAGITGSTVTAFKFAHATAEQRCRAFIATMEKEA